MNILSTYVFNILILRVFEIFFFSRIRFWCFKHLMARPFLLLTYFSVSSKLPRNVHFCHNVSIPCVMVFRSGCRPQCIGQIQNEQNQTQTFSLMDTLMTIFSLFSLPIFTFTSTSFSRIFIICNCIWFYSCLVVGWLFHSLLMLLLFLLRSFPCVWAPLTYISLLVVVSVIKSP